MYKMIIKEIATKKNGWQICTDTQPSDNLIFPKVGSPKKASPVSRITSPTSMLSPKIFKGPFEKSENSANSAHNPGV